MRSIRQTKPVAAPGRQAAHATCRTPSALPVLLVAAACLTACAPDEGGVLDGFLSACGGLNVARLGEDKVLDPACREAAELLLSEEVSALVDGAVPLAVEHDAERGVLDIAVQAIAGGRALGAAELAGADVSLIRDGVRELVDPARVSIRTISAAAGDLVHVAFLADCSASVRPGELGLYSDIFSRILDRLPGEIHASAYFFSEDIEVRADRVSSREELLATLRTDPGIARARTALFDAVARALDDLEGRPGLRLLVAVTDGKDNASSKNGAEDISARLDRVPVGALALGTFFASPVSLRKMIGSSGTLVYMRSMERLLEPLEAWLESVEKAARVTVAGVHEPADAIELAIGSSILTIDTPALSAAAPE